MKIDGFLKRVVFASGLELTLGREDILVVIGPNNSGKSATLRELASRVRDGSKSVLISDVELERLTQLADLVAAYTPFANQSGQVSIGHHGFHLTHLNMWWGGVPTAAIGPFLGARILAELSTRERLGDCDPAPLYDRRMPFSADHPFQHFHKDDKLEIRASKLFRRAFKKDLVIHRGNSTNIPAYIGDRPKPAKGERTDSTSYYDRIEALDRLEVQGDGMRSFTSILGRVLAEDRPIILIDEPEAFLHPPQARMLADIIASENAGRQTLIATHSSDVLQGLLTKHASRVSVVRLKRTAAGGSAVLLSSEEVAELWKDPILRFSNILDGLFHDAVIVTEADADCRFYEALAASSLPDEQLPDLHYTYSGGKDRLPVVIKALKGLGVPVVTIADFDLLNNDSPLSKIVGAHGGDWTVIEPQWRAVKVAVEQSKMFLDADKFKLEIQAVLKGIKSGGSVDKDALRRVKELARSASAWDNAKKSGLASLPNGTPYNAAETLLMSLKELGIFVAPVGEMEGFCRSVGGHGPRWVEEAMKRDLKGDPDLAGARKFVEEIVKYLNAKLA